MRLLLYWMGLVALSFYASSLRHNYLFYLFLLLLFCYAVLLVNGTFRSLWARITHAVRERAIKRRDATTESPLERMLAGELDRRGIRYEREYRISRITVDFALPQAKLVVECDGWRYHHEHAGRDAARDAFLRRSGWKVVRFSGEQLRKDIRACGQKVSDHL